jgi:hypothetical protein
MFYLPSFLRSNSKISNKFGNFCSISVIPVGARETRLPVGNQISRPVTKSLVGATSFERDVPGHARRNVLFLNMEDYSHRVPVSSPGYITGQRSAEKKRIQRQFQISIWDFFKYLVERIIKIINGWKNKTLSMAGNETLLKAVAQAMSVFVMSIFKIQKKHL